MADLYRRNDDKENALKSYRKALNITKNPIEIKFIEKRIKEVSMTTSDISKTSQKSVIEKDS